MKVLEFTDLHVTRTAEFSAPTEDGLTEYLQAFARSIEFVRDLAIQEKPDVLVFGGDFFDSADYIDTMSLYAAQKIMRILDVLECEKIALLGNHDYWSIEHNIHSLGWLTELGWDVVDTPRIVPTAKGKILAVPFRDHYDLEHLGSLVEEEHDVVFTHLDVVGGILRSGKENYYSTEGLTPSFFKKSPIVFNGHYHHPSKVASNFHNVGALTARTFSDKASDPRGAITYDTETEELQRFDNPHVRRFEEFWVYSPEDLDTLLCDDLSSVYAKVHYASDLEEQVLASQDFFAGSRLIPLKRKKEEETNTDSVDMRFSLRENLERYLDAEYDDAPSLRALALEVFDEAIKDYEESTNRLPLDFGRLEIHNYQSLGTIVLDLRNQGLVFIDGTNDDDPEQQSNGSGKSSLIEAIYWCLTGKSLRGYKVNDVIHWNRKHVRVSLEVLAGSNTYTIVRSRKDPEYGTGVKLYDGDSSAGARLASDTQERIDEILGRTEKNLKHISFLTADLSSRYSALTQDQRARLLEDIVDLRPYYLSQKITKAKKESAAAELGLALGELRGMTTAETAAKGRIEVSEASIEDFDEKNQDALERIAQEILDEAERRRVAEELKAREVEKVAEVESSITVLTKKREEFEEKRRALGRSASPIQQEASGLKNEIIRMNNLVEKTLCPTCEQKVPESIRGDLASVRVRFDGLIKAGDEAEVEIQATEKRIARFVSALREKESQRRSASTAILESDSAIRLTYEREKRLESDKANRLSSRERFVFAKDEAQKTIEELAPKIEELVNSSSELEQREAMCGILQHEVFDERGVRGSVLAQVAAPYMSARLPEYTSMMYGGKNLEINPKDLSIVLPGKRTYIGNSSGERRRVDLMLQLVLNDLSVATGRSRVGFLAIDEVLDKLDAPGVASVKEVLEQKAEGMTIWMTSHVPYAASICPNKLRLVKRGEVTEIAA